VALALSSFIRRADRHWAIAWSIAGFGVLYSLYLTTVSMTVLGAACPYCLTSLALMTSILVVTTLQRPATMQNFLWSKWLAWRLPGMVAIVLLLHLHYSGFIGEAPAAEDPSARALAQHLSETGAKFYGAFWCPHCQDQKAIFGRSATRLPYIECSPQGQGARQADACIQANIQSYPTWIINGQRHEEVLGLKQLSDLSGFQQAASSN
jgi:glutaredoxin